MQALKSKIPYVLHQLAIDKIMEILLGILVYYVGLLVTRRELPY